MLSNVKVRVTLPVVVLHYGVLLIVQETVGRSQLRKVTRYRYSLLGTLNLFEFDEARIRGYMRELEPTDLSYTVVKGVIDKCSQRQIAFV